MITLTRMTRHIDCSWSICSYSRKRWVDCSWWLCLRSWDERVVCSWSVCLWSWERQYTSTNIARLVMIANPTSNEPFWTNLHRLKIAHRPEINRKAADVVLSLIRVCSIGALHSPIVIFNSDNLSEMRYSMSTGMDATLTFETTFSHWLTPFEIHKYSQMPHTSHTSMRTRSSL